MKNSGATVGAVIRQARTRLKLTQQELADKVGVSRQSVAAWEADTSLPLPDNAAVLSQALHIPLSTIAADPSQLNVAFLDRDAHNVTSVPILSWIEAGRGSEVVAAYALEAAHEYVDSDAPVSKASFALRVSGSSMEPEFPEGTVIIVDPLVAPHANDFVVAELLPKGTEPGHGRAMLKQYHPRGREAFDLVALNPDFPTVTVNKDNRGRIIGTVVEAHRRYHRR